MRALVREHGEKTASPRAAAILADWDRFRPLFHKVVPHAAPEPQAVPLAADAPDQPQRVP